MNSAATPNFSDSAERTTSASMKVSSRSRFGDEIWDFTEETDRSRAILSWTWKVNSELSFDSPELSAFRLALKQYIVTLIKGWSLISSKASPRTAISEVENVRGLIDFLYNERGKRSFTEVSPLDYRKFIDREVAKLRPPKSIARILKSACRLVDEKEFIDPEIRLEVGPTQDAYDFSSSRGRAHSTGKTRCIPTQVLEHAWQVAVDYLVNCAPYILKIREQELEYRLAETEKRITPWEHQKFWIKDSWNLDNPKYSSSGFAQFVSKLDPPHRSAVLPDGIRDKKHYTKVLINLRRAAILVLGITTGVRLSSLMTLKMDCLRVGTGRNGQKLIWLSGRTFKTADDPRGQDTEWVCGEYGALAVRILRAWGGLARSQNRLIVALKPKRIQGVFVGDDHGTSAEEAVSDVAGLFIDHNICDSNGRPWRFASHQMRTTFVRLVCTHSNTPLDELQGHLGHLSINMTDYYLGTDPQLWLEYYQSVYDISREKIAYALRETALAGAGGEKISSEIDNAIKAGRLPKYFRGHAGESIRLRMAEDFIRSGQHIYFLETNFCRFRPSLAACNPEGKEPLAHLCHPLKCKNAYITSEHAKIWEAQADSIQDALKKYSRSAVLRPALAKQHRVATDVLKRISRNRRRNEKSKQS